MGRTSIAATTEERRRAFPGDGLLDESLATWTHGVTIAAPPRAVWPWLAQMGVGRAGWYSWDRLDNGGLPSAERIVPELARVHLGEVLPAGPGVTNAFVVARLEPERDLVLGVPWERGQVSATWEFLLDPLPGARTRLLVRTRVSARGWLAPLEPTTPSAVRVTRALARLPRGPILALARAAHRVMQARQLRGIRRRAEGALPGVTLARIIRAENGMDIFGQGIRILLFTAPALAAAVVAQALVPDLLRIPLPGPVRALLGAALLVPGVAMWATAVVQLLVAFPRGRLVTAGAYGVCRNPIYSSVALLILPGVSLASGSWGWLLPAAALWLGVRIFIPTEERDLLRVFGDEYRRYTARVHRVVPFLKPRRGVA